MIASFGEASARFLLKDFIEVSQGKIEINEHNTEKGIFQHDSGWGLVYESASEKKVYKTIKQAWKDNKIKNFYNAEIRILHARKASVGGVKLENTHPFRFFYKGKDWFFCHNGFVGDKFPKFAGIEGDTDSEQLFRYLLENLDEKKDVAAIKKAINKLENYTSLNSFLYNGEVLYAINCYKKYPLYYNLKILKDKGKIIISSEILPSFKGKWENLKNGQIVKVNKKNLTVEIF